MYTNSNATNQLSQGNFYKDTDTRDKAVFGTSEGQKDYSYIPPTLIEVRGCVLSRLALTLHLPTVSSQPWFIRSFLLLSYFYRLQSSADGYYDQNDTIGAFTNVSDLLVASGSGYFEVPIAGFTGACVDANHVKFERETEQQRCTRTFQSNATFASQCEKDFSMARYVQNLWLAK